MPGFFEFLYFIWGLILGSFASALAWRVPRGMSVITSSEKQETPARSACPKCGHVLGVFDLIPLFSWMFSGGKCRYCKAPISVTYPLIEAGTALAAVGIYWAMGATVQSIFVVALLPFLAALIVIDFRHMILPDKLILVCAVIGVLRLLTDYFLQHTATAEILFYGAAAIFYGGFAWGLSGLMTFLLKKQALGFGDVKFFAAAGLWLGFSALPLFLIIAGLCGVVIGLIWRVYQGKGAFPFGPALIASLYICILLNGSGIVASMGL